MPLPTDAKPQWVVPGSLSTATTLSTVQLYARIRRTMLDYITPQGERLVDYLGAERVYVSRQPEPVVFPYLTLLLDRTTDGAFNGYRETAQLEVQAMGKPESQLPLVESAMDIVDQCLTSLTDAGAGLIVGRVRNRQTVPLFTDPAESSVVGVIARYQLFLWPQVLSSRAGT